MQISDDYQTTNRTVLEIIQGIVDKVLSINIKSHILQFILQSNTLLSGNSLPNNSNTFFLFLQLDSSNIK